MGATSTIEWTDATWNPVRGCSRVSEGCRNCYAERQAARFSNSSDAFHGFAEMTPSGPRWTGRVELVEERLEDPLHWKTPKRMFVNSMSDLFHEKLPLADFLRVFEVMQMAHWHTYQVLTKRPEQFKILPNIVLPNVWFGVSVENQATADERIPLLLQTPAAIRFVSYEPALGPVDFHLETYPEGAYLDWIIVGGESGPGARPFDIAWARDTIAQCKAAGVACFVKQLGTAWAKAGMAMDDHKPALDRKGGDWDEWPEDLRVREFPEVRV
jgi:protein gp37